MATVNRPVLHYAPPTGWVNDPLALTWHDGRYHLFVQHVPDSVTWDVACRWGHATSDDLLTWQTHPVALEPDDGEDGVWSGNLVRPEPGKAVLFYTAVDEENKEIGRVRRATPADESWLTWDKEDVVVRLPEGERAIAFRDPFVHPYGDGWRMLVGGGLVGGDAVAWMFASDDLAQWRYLGPAASRSGVDREPVDGVWTGTAWECPVLVEVDGQTVFVVSVWEPWVPHYLAYAFAKHAGDRLELGPWQRLSYGPSLYAASPFTDADGLPGLVAWLRDIGDPSAGWMGATSLPYRLHVSGGQLVARPHPAVDSRRVGEPMEGALPPVADVEWRPAVGDTLHAAGVLRLDALADSIVLTVDQGRYELPWNGEPVRVIVDGPIVEIFGQRGVLAAPADGAGHDVPLIGALERSDRASVGMTVRSRQRAADRPGSRCSGQATPSPGLAMISRWRSGLKPVRPASSSRSWPAHATWRATTPGRSRHTSTPSSPTRSREMLSLRLGRPGSSRGSTSTSSATSRSPAAGWPGPSDCSERWWH